MRLREVRVRKWGPLREGQWTIETNDSSIILAGDHGTGKSTFLRAISYGFVRLLTHNLGASPPNEENHRVELDIVPVSPEDHKLLRNQSTFVFPSTSSINHIRSVIFGNRVPFGGLFPSNLGFLLDTADSAPPIRGWGRTQVELLWFDPFPLAPKSPRELTAAFLFECRTDESRQSALSRINDVLAKMVNLELYEARNILRCHRIGSRFPIRAAYLSDAENYAISIALLLQILPSSSVVLLDSPESRLHPAGQLAAQEMFVRHLSEGQLIVATHSPSLLAIHRAESVYILNHSAGPRVPKMSNLEGAQSEVRRLYGDNLAKAVLSSLSDFSSQATLTYLLQCSINPESVQRKPGDPQLQQLGMWIHGRVADFTRQRRLRVIDLGAGRGDLLEAIRLSGCAEQIEYIPIESSTAAWAAINTRASGVPALMSRNALPEIKDIDRADIIFIVNVLHELPLEIRTQVLAEAFRITGRTGIMVVHEVSPLPKGEANFVMWDADDLRDVISSADATCTLRAASTVSRPGGWPLRTVSVSVDNLPTSAQLLRGALNALPRSLDRWCDRMAAPLPEDLKPELRDTYRAFLMAQIANLSVWARQHRRLRVEQESADASRQSESQNSGTKDEGSRLAPHDPPK